MGGLQNFLHSVSLFECLPLMPPRNGDDGRNEMDQYSGLE